MGFHGHIFRMLISVIVVDGLENGLGCHGPAMGWSSWNTFGPKLSESLIIETVDAIVSSGLKDSGYQYVNIDDGWSVGRFPNHTLKHDSNLFPRGIAYVADYVHSKGLLFGIYGARGNLTCQGRPGSLGFEELDAQTFASWGVDFLKYDSCDGSDDPETAWDQYATMRDSLNKTGREMWYSITQRMTFADLNKQQSQMYCVHPPRDWGAFTVLPWVKSGKDVVGIANSYLIEFCNNHDVFGHTGVATGFLSQLDSQALLTFDSLTVAGAYNDADMLECCHGDQTDAEYRSQFSTFAILTSPLILGNDVRNMSQSCLDIIANKEIIALNQDSRVARGTLVYQFPDKHWPRDPTSATYFDTNRYNHYTISHNDIITSNHTTDSDAAGAVGMKSLETTFSFSVDVQRCNASDSKQNFSYNEADGSVRAVAHDNLCLTYGGYQLSNVGVQQCQTPLGHHDPCSQQWEVDETDAQLRPVGSLDRALNAYTCNNGSLVDMAVATDACTHEDDELHKCGVRCTSELNSTAFVVDASLSRVLSRASGGCLSVGAPAPPQPPHPPSPPPKGNMNITLQVWVKHLSQDHTGGLGVVVFNRGEVATSLNVTWDMISLPPNCAATVRDLWQHADKGVFTSGYTCSNIGPHDVCVLKIVPSDGAGCSMIAEQP
eukprot:m.104901 g.104901  ORF g.104901 m.104901 type:complete len:660 (+) comp27602_c1_seq1:1807-3786(+)